MAGFDALLVDLDLLDETVEELTQGGVALDDLLDEVSRRVAALQRTWGGAAALAQEGAQAEWEAGFREMREALVSMRKAGQVARDSYHDAAGTNLQMWGQVT